MNPLPVNINGLCRCELCKGEFLQVDPIGCECTECITHQYRPAIDEDDYAIHNGEIGTNDELHSQDDETL